MASLIRRGDAPASGGQFGGELLARVEGADGGSVGLRVRRLGAEAGRIELVSHRIPQIKHAGSGAAGGIKIDEIGVAEIGSGINDGDDDALSGKPGVAPAHDLLGNSSSGQTYL